MATYKDKMNEAIIDTAQELFLKKSISKVLISEVAKEAEIGEATIYRYFKTKQNLALKVALKEWKSVGDSFREEMNGNGYQRLCVFYSMFEKTFMEHRNFFAFLFDLDQLISSEEALDLREYQETLLDIKKLYDEAYELGIQDRSVQPIEEKDLFYYTSTHALLSLCKHLAKDNPVDEGIAMPKEKEIGKLISIIENSLKGEAK